MYFFFILFLFAFCTIRTTTAVVFWQWVNQSFNALVNYTNRNANSPVTTGQLGFAYASATAAAMVTAIGCKSFLKHKAGPLMAVCFIFLIFFQTQFFSVFIFLLTIFVSFFFRGTFHLQR